MNKRLIRLLPIALAAFLLIHTSAWADTAEVQEIRTAQEFLAIRHHPSGNYALCSDIDLATVDWIPFPFSGTLDGRGYSVYNLRIHSWANDTATVLDGNRKTYSSCFSGLFSVSSGAVIRNLTLVDAELTIDPEDNCFAGLLCGFSDGSIIEGCRISGRGTLDSHGVVSGLGGIVGYGTAIIQNTYVDAELIYTDLYSAGKCEQFLGGILSCGRASINNCSVDLNGYVSCNGYVHSGGLVGMYAICGIDWSTDRVCNNNVNGSIHFYENNRDRRAYCQAYVGENLCGSLVREDNHSSFSRDETFDYSRILLPEACLNPVINDSITPPDCSSWGFTTHICTGCGYSYRDQYTSPAHSPGSYTETVAPQVGVEGLEELYCLECGILLEARTIPALPHPMSCSLEQACLMLKKGVSIQLPILLEHCTENDLSWFSSDPSIVSVDSGGRATAHAKGTCTITVCTADGASRDSCEVFVLGFWQALWYALSR